MRKFIDSLHNGRYVVCGFGGYGQGLRFGVPFGSGERAGRIEESKRFKPENSRGGHSSFKERKQLPSNENGFKGNRFR